MISDELTALTGFLSAPQSARAYVQAWAEGVTEWDRGLLAGAFYALYYDLVRYPKKTAPPIFPAAALLARITLNGDSSAEKAVVWAAEKFLDAALVPAADLEAA